MTEPILTLHELRVTYRTLRGPVHAVRGVSLAVPTARIFGLVGESGSGKSTVAQAVMGALRGRARVEGEVRYRGANLLDKPMGELRRLWGRRLAMVFQDPTSTLNPVLTVGAQLVEVLREHEALSTRQAEERARTLFTAVRLPRPSGAIPISSLGASSSACRSPSRWRATPTCSSWTSRRPVSTSRPRPASSIWWNRSASGPAPRSSTSATTSG
jgi:ABC-type glutathione transport system ATPase component